MSGYQDWFVRVPRQLRLGIPLSWQLHMRLQVPPQSVTTWVYLDRILKLILWVHHLIPCCCPVAVTVSTIFLFFDDSCTRPRRSLHHVPHISISVSDIQDLSAYPDIQWISNGYPLDMHLLNLIYIELIIDTWISKTDIIWICHRYMDMWIS